MYADDAAEATSPLANENVARTVQLGKFFCEAIGGMSVTIAGGGASMAKLHVLRINGDQVELLIHFIMPSGSNSVAITWKAAALAAGLIGLTPHAMADSTEKVAIQAGDTVELQTSLDMHEVNPSNLSGTPLVAALNAVANAKKAEWLAEQQKVLKYWGYKQGTVS